LFNI
jgi:hypothetical protein